MSVQATYASNCTVVETLANNTASAPDATRKVTHSNFNTAVTLNSGSTPPATKVAAFEVALTAGSGSIDLTALTGTNGEAVDGSGLRVQAIKIRNKSTNANAISIAKGASNGYDGFGANFKITLAVGADAMLLSQDAGSDISGTNKIFDLVGTGSQVLQVLVVLG